MDTDSQERVIGVRGFGDATRQMANQIAANHEKSAGVKSFVQSM
ncbi:hypothetical protein L489_5520 [Bordetella bronchiseptica 00-P-2730]|nr:hypothetical protein L489_5520 [Bordetella bronchiseptica 00-P-2730]